MGRSDLRKALPRIQGKGDKTSRLNSLLVDLSKKTATQLEYWAAFQRFLADQREKRKQQIHAALRVRAVSGYENDKLVRIVDTRYQTRPLSSYGSIAVPPGGRFNFGEISSYFQKFQALYLASDFATAAAERFLRDQQTENGIDQESLDFRLDPNASFTCYRVRVQNLTVIDIRDNDTLQPFVEVISEIEPPRWMHDLAKRLKQPTPRTVKSVEQLKSLILDKNFVQSGSLIDQPSSSQWLGYYVREAGIHGILYPSVRDPRGYNLAILHDTFGELSPRVELIDDADGVRTEDKVLDGTNAAFQMMPSHIQSKALH